MLKSLDCLSAHSYTVRFCCRVCKCIETVDSVNALKFLKKFKNLRYDPVTLGSTTIALILSSKWCKPTESLLCPGAILWCYERAFLTLDI